MQILPPKLQQDWKQSSKQHKLKMHNPMLDKIFVYKLVLIC
jgi:hypothetical protein